MIDIRTWLRRFLVDTGLAALAPSAAELEQGLAEVETLLLRIAVEAADAETRGIPLRQAWKDDSTFPMLSKLHHSVGDLLTLKLPPEFVAFLESLFAKPPVQLIDDIQVALGRMLTAESVSPTVRSLARVLLYQGLRCSLLLLERIPQASAKVFGGALLHPQRDTPGLIACGIDPDDVDGIAERELDWLARRGQEVQDIRPLDTLWAMALVEIQREMKRVRDVLAMGTQELMERRRLHDELERRLQRMDSTDAVIIRNELAPALREQSLSIELLKVRHPVALGQLGRNAIDQRASRLRRKVAQREFPERTNPALVDLLAAQLKEIP